MYPSFPVLRQPQRGSILLVAIFSMIALSGLGLALMKINASQQSITTRETLGSRAWFAAQSGNQWAMTQLFPLLTAGTLPKARCNYTGVVTPFSGSGLIGCSVSVSCKEVIGVGVSPLSQYYVESKGQCGSGEYAVVRVQEMWAKGI